jgi:hypothetical protein
MTGVGREDGEREIGKGVGSVVGRGVGKSEGVRVWGVGKSEGVRVCGVGRGLGWELGWELGKELGWELGITVAVVSGSLWTGTFSFSKRVRTRVWSV